MKIVIAGAGEVGFHLAKLLSYESQEITLIDLNKDSLVFADTHMDIKVIKGDATSISVLKPPRHPARAGNWKKRREVCPQAWGGEVSTFFIFLLLLLWLKSVLHPSLPRGAPPPQRSSRFFSRHACFATAPVGELAGELSQSYGFEP